MIRILLTARSIDAWISGGRHYYLEEFWDRGWSMFNTQYEESDNEEDYHY
jgi:hypothetical protein